MIENVIGICDWCGESFVIRSGCECKKLASNQEWLSKAGLIKKMDPKKENSEHGLLVEEKIRAELNNI